MAYLILDDIFKFLISMVGPNHTHVWSLLVYAAFCLLVFVKLVRYLHPIYAFMIAYVIGMVGNNVYESLWQYIMYETGINSYFMQYIVVDIGLVVLLLVANYKFKCLRLNKWVIILGVIELSTFYFLAVTGHYDALRIWIANGYQPSEIIQTDPHNLLWMLNKALGVWFLYPLVLSKEQYKERVK
jgi:hypothetical protein